MKTTFAVTIDGISYTVVTEGTGETTQIYRNGMNGGELRRCGDDGKWFRFDTGRRGVIIVQVGEMNGLWTIDIHIEYREHVVMVPLVSAK